MITKNPSHRTYNGAEFLVHALVSAGVTHVFGGHGGSVVPLIDAIEANPYITWVCCRCEVNASQAAAAYAKLHGKLGCCVATSGPGAAHMLAGLVDGDQDRVPVLCITGMKETGHIRHADFQDIDQASIFRMACLAMSEAVIDIYQLLPLTRNAITVAVASNRVAHLAVPVDIQQEEVEARNQFCLGTAYQKKVTKPATRLEVDTLVMALRAEIEDRRHVLIACGWRAHGLGREVERLAELLHAPVLTSFDGKGTADERHPLSFGVVGVYGNSGTPSSVDLLENCDTVVSVCITDHTELIANSKDLQVRRLIQIDERLLAGDSLRFSPSAVFSCGYLKDSIRRVIKKLERGLGMNEKHTYRLSELHPDDHGTIHPETGMEVWDNLRLENFSKPAGTPSTYLEGKCCADSADIRSSKFCHPAVFFDIMSRSLREDAVICADIGDNALWMASSLSAKRGQRILTSEHMGIMGYSMNAAVAASVSCASKAEGNKGEPKQILVVAGDGGIQMSMNEIATMRDHGARNVLVVVVVNNRLGRVQNETWGVRLNADGCHIGSPDYVKLFEAYGYLNGAILSTCNSNEVSKTIENGWSMARSNGICVIELRQNPAVHPVMHKMKNKAREKSSLVDWEAKTRNTRTDSIFPEIETDHWSEHQSMLQGWLESLSKPEKSQPYWLNLDNFASFSPSKTVQVLLNGLGHLMPGKEAPTLFATLEARETFDSHFKSSLLNSFPADVVESVLLNGTSNTHPLCIQLLALPKEHNFPLHAHPNVELDIPLVGDLWERRPLKVTLPEVIFMKDTPVGQCEGNFFQEPSEEELDMVKETLKKRTVFEDVGEDGRFVERVARQGQVLYNETGSVHQSFTKGEGCLMMLLWSAVHAHFAPGNFRQKIGVDDLVLD